MSKTFPQPAVLSLLNSMPAPLMLFNVAGEITFSNSAAQRMPRVIEVLNRHKGVQEVVRRAVLGTVQLPITANLPPELAGDGGTAPSGTFLLGPSGVDIALILARPGADKDNASEQQDRTTLVALVRLMQQEVLPELRTLRETLDRLEEPDEAKRAAQAAGSLLTQLERLEHLAEVFGDQAALLDQRISLQQDLERCKEELGPWLERYSIKLLLPPEWNDLPTVFGNARILHRLFLELIQFVSHRARAEVAQSEGVGIRIGVDGVGRFARISVRSMGAIHTGLKLVNEAPVNVVPEPPPFGERVMLPYAKEAVRLHGGKLRIIDGDTVEVIVELPAGAPVAAPRDLGAQQARAYAADLSKLMERVRSRGQ